MIRLAVRAAPDAAERVNAALLELSPSGIERVDGPGFVEFAIYGAPGELPALGDGEAEIAGARVHVRGDPVPDDWEERWRRFHVPALIAGQLWVRPPWEQPAVRPGVREIVIDPGQAFGTGSHPTTSLCLELLLGRPARGSLADLGCGSGVLAIAAAKLGFRPVRAYDAERSAVAATLRNARDNGVELDTIERFDLRHAVPPAADTVVANLMHPLLISLAERLVPRPPALIVSGLLDAEADEVAAALAPLAEQRRLRRGGWTALLLTR